MLPFLMIPAWDLRDRPGGGGSNRQCHRWHSLVVEGGEGDCPTISHPHPHLTSAPAISFGLGRHRRGRDAWLKKAVRASPGCIFGDWQGGLAVGQLVVAAHGGDVAVVMALGSPVSGSLRLLQLVWCAAAARGWRQRAVLSWNPPELQMGRKKRAHFVV